MSSRPSQPGSERRSSELVTVMVRETSSAEWASRWASPRARECTSAGKMRRGCSISMVSCRARKRAARGVHTA
eukprot:4856054-Prymnesium_polylepis.1